MKATELRINNALLYDSEVKIVSSIHSDDTIRFYDKEKGSIGCFKIRNKLIQPIPLTEESLFNLGLNKTKYYYYFDKNGEFPFQYDLEDNIFYFSRNHQAFFRVQIKYIHQLQNLYFALTGEELTLKI